MRVKHAGKVPPFSFPWAACPSKLHVASRIHTAQSECTEHVPAELAVTRLALHNNRRPHILLHRVGRSGQWLVFAHPRKTGRSWCGCCKLLRMCLRNDRMADWLCLSLEIPLGRSITRIEIGVGPTLSFYCISLTSLPSCQDAMRPRYKLGPRCWTLVTFALVGCRLFCPQLFNTSSKPRRGVAAVHATPTAHSVVR